MTTSWQDTVIAAIIGLGVIGLLFLGVKCNRDDDVVKAQESAHRAEVQKECLRAGHSALECKELR